MDKMGQKDGMEEERQRLVIFKGDDLEMPMGTSLKGSALKTRHQDYVYLNCLLGSKTMSQDLRVSLICHVKSIQLGK